MIFDFNSILFSKIWICMYSLIQSILVASFSYVLSNGCILPLKVFSLVGIVEEKKMFLFICFALRYFFRSLAAFFTDFEMNFMHDYQVWFEEVQARCQSYWVSFLSQISMLFDANRVWAGREQLYLTFILIQYIKVVWCDWNVNSDGQNFWAVFATKFWCD